LEGPADQETFRYSHPYQLISSLLQQDSAIGLSALLCQEISTAFLRYLLTNSLSIQEGIVDYIFRANSITLLSHLLSGLESFYFHPSLAPMHQHTIPHTLRCRQLRAQEFATNQQATATVTATGNAIVRVSPLKLFSQCKHEISELIQHICQTIYKTRRDDLLPCGDNGQCYLSRVVKLLTIFADFDDILVWYVPPPLPLPSPSSLSSSPWS
jgi:hypothetical protein